MSNKKPGNNNSNSFPSSSQEVQDICKINTGYVHTLKKTIKQMELLLNVRLRVEFPDALEVLNELNTKLLHFTETTQEIDQIYKKISGKYTEFTESIHKARKYDELLVRLNDIEISYKNSNNELLSCNKKQEQEIAELRQELSQTEQTHGALVGDLSKLRNQLETTVNDSKLKEAELNRVKIEKDSLKRQLSNLNSLLKQVNEEKEVNSQKMQTTLEDKLTQLKEEIKKIKEQYTRKLGEKDLKIERLERDLQLLKKEVELNQDFTFLQSSLGASLQKQSINSSSQGLKQRSPSKKEDILEAKLLSSSKKKLPQKLGSAGGNSGSSSSKKKALKQVQQQHASVSPPKQFSPPQKELKEQNQAEIDEEEDLDIEDQRSSSFDEENE